MGQQSSTALTEKERELQGDNLFEETAVRSRDDENELDEEQRKKLEEIKANV